MRIRRRASKPIRETQMVSLADIAFLLIFFFMLSSQFMRDRVQVDLPGAPRSDRTDSAISVVLDRDAHIHLDGQPVDTADALQSQLVARLAGRTDAKAREVRFRCHRTIAYKDYHPVYEAISAAGGVICLMHDVR
jgi:biopolymer transport protein ExbD